MSQADAAELLNVGIRSVQHGCEVLEKATPELIAAVDQGRVAVSLTAAQMHQRVRGVHPRCAIHVIRRPIKTS